MTLSNYKICRAAACSFVLFFSGPGFSKYSDSNHGSTPIRVLLEGELQELVLRSPTASQIYWRAQNTQIWKKISSPVDLRLVQFRDHQFFSVNGNLSDASQIEIRGGTNPWDLVSIGNNSFRGALRVSRSHRGLKLINEVSIEDYLMGTLPAEMQPSWGIEALKAQVVAARTYALFMLTHPKNSEFDVEGGIQDQAYKGHGDSYRRIIDAIVSTRGMYLGKNNLPEKTFYHSRCGGETDSPNSVWGIKSHMTTSRTRCEFCRNSPQNWRATLSADEVVRKVGLFLSPTKHLRISIIERSPTGRATTVEVKTETSKKRLTADKFRSLFGYQKIKSALFSAETINGKIELTGVGNGHGVGMCQWGAQAMAKQGKTFRDILRHFYPDLSLYSPIPEVKSFPVTVLSP